MRFLSRLAMVLPMAFLVSFGSGAQPVVPAPRPAPATLARLWEGKARFVRVGTLDWRGAGDEQAGSFVVRRGVWYVFNRAAARIVSPECRQDRARIVARMSRDHGLTWSDPVTVADPGGATCAVLDGSAFFDASTSTWHLLAQCLGAGGTGWSLCHYSRRSPSPLGRFAADPSNPVVSGGMLWSRLCGGAGKACPATTRDEGTPDIVAKQNGSFAVTFHGFDPVARQGYRGVATTADFRRWKLAGGDLPGDATLGPRDCGAWLQGCAGVGEATSLDHPIGGYRYMIAETMTKSLQCTRGQQWQFELLRAKMGLWPRSGHAGWYRLPKGIFLATAHPSTTAACPLQYARLIQDQGTTYLVYEDWNRANGTVDRPVLKLVDAAR